MDRELVVADDAGGEDEVEALSNAQACRCATSDADGIRICTCIPRLAEAGVDRAFQGEDADLGAGDVDSAS